MNNKKLFLCSIAWLGLALLSVRAQTTTLPTESAPIKPLSVEEFKEKFPQITQLINPDVLKKDSTVLCILKRNVSQWQDMALVCDWTESMYPYGIQVLYWLHYFADNEKITKWTFFNDGNERQQGEKEVGRTGGIYAYEGSKLEEVMTLMQRVKKAGNGGDTPENDLEALLFAQNRFVGLKHLVLLADASSEIRDILLIKKLARLLRLQGTQLHILLCGEPIAYDYLYLAQVCNASIHTSKEDWENLGNWQEGQELQLNGTAYLLKDGYFIKANTSNKRKKK